MAIFIILQKVSYMSINKSIFREYDIRGIVKSEQDKNGELNEQSVKLLGYFLGQRIVAKSNSTTPYVSVGYDARTHGLELFDYLTSGLNKAGCKVLNMGMVATGVNYFSNYIDFEIENTTIQTSASIMITGSHNPSNYNGFKITVDKAPFFGDDIYALGEELIINADMNIEDNTSCIDIDVKSRYIDYIVDEFKDLKIEDKIILDCGNGVADTVLTEICDRLNLNYEAMYKEPDGTFPNHHPDPSEEKNLVDINKRLLNDDFKFGFAYDGDADRIAVLTTKNNIKGDILAILFSKTMDNPTIIGEVKCTQVMYDMIDEIGTAIMYKTGHSNLKVKLKETNADFAAEVSGHLFFNDRYFGYDDAIYATFRVLELIDNGMDLDAEIAKLPKTYSTEEIKVHTTEEEKFEIIDRLKELLKEPNKYISNFPAIKDIIDVDGVRVIFDEGWGLVRASNTTPVLVTRFESTDENRAKEYEEVLNELIKVAQESK